MGVHGLTTYLRENRRNLSASLSLPSGSQEPTSIVVDGWSFIYDLHRNSNLPWVYGGEYNQFSKLVATVVQAWIKVGLNVYFVFDGACPELKFSTQVSRIGQSHIQPSLLFFRTSSTSRGTARFLNETRIIPPLAYTACINALTSLKKSTGSLQLHFADEEGDPYAVELAGRIGGYVVGNDSDFVVLNTEGYLGYIPLEEMMWYAPVSTEALSQEYDGDFQEVRKPKTKRRPVIDAGVGRGLIPPEVGELTLTLTIYKPDVLASHLKIPVTLLPLLGALVGNDFFSQSESSRRTIQSLFFERQLSLSQRINRVAATIQNILSPLTPKRKKQKHQIGSVMDLIDRAVNALLARLQTSRGSGEIDSIVDQVVEATLQYAIPKREATTLDVVGGICALHEESTCPIFPFFSRRIISIVEASEEENSRLQNFIKVRTRYLNSYRHGHFAPKIMDILVSGTFWPRLFLENPDLETVSRSIGRPIREWIFSILHDAVGLSETLEEGSSQSSDELESDEEDLDQLIDVVESDSEDDDDLLAPLKGELHRLRRPGNEGSGASAAPSSQSPRLMKLPIVTEYLRRGTRVAQEEVIVRPFQELLANASLPNSEMQNNPFLLRPIEERLTLFLRALESDVAPVRALPLKYIIPVLAIRWVVRTMHLRAEDTKSKEREQERWTKDEATCFLASLDSCASTTPEAQQPTPITDRHIQLTAQALQALESVEHLSQVLLLAEELPFSAHSLSGTLFHKHLAESGAHHATTVPPTLLEATSYGLGPAFSERRDGKKSKRAQSGIDILGPGNRNTKVPKSGGLYKMLLDLDVV